MAQSEKPDFSVSTDTIDFGSSKYGRELYEIVRITNHNSSEMSYTLGLQGYDAYAGHITVGQPYTFTLLPERTFEISVKLKMPHVKAYEATLNIVCDDVAE